MKKIITLIFISFLSCNKKETKLLEANVSNEIETQIANVNFPDTIHINKIYEGNIIYTSTFDSITTKLNADGEITRYIMLIYYEPYNLNKDKNQFTEIITDTTFTYKLPEVPIRNIQFKEPGKYQLNWLIKDMVIFDTIKGRKDSEPLPMKIEETRVSKRIVVVK